jgi:triacylglycerol lipase
MPPLVLHHGFMGLQLRAGPLNWSYFRGIDRALLDEGYPVITSRVHPTAGIERRARQLKEIVLRQLGILDKSKERVIVIGHSMGGLDARYMITRLGMADRVQALLTVTTPHRGSPYADWCLRHLGERLGGIRLVKFLGLDMQSVADLTTKSMRRFNEEVPDHPDVRYFSVSAARPWYLVPPFAMHAYKVIHDAEGENDGLVSVRSAKWGEHLSTWPADHFHTINKRLVIELRNPTGDITPYYVRALAELSAKLGPAEPAA